MKTTIIKKIILIVLPLLAATTVLRAQNPAADTTGANRLAAGLAIKKEKANQVHRLLTSLPVVQMDNLPANAHTQTLQTQQRMMRLLDDRRRKVDSLLTPAQRALLLQQQMADRKSQAAAAIAAHRQADEQQMPPVQVITGAKKTSDNEK